MRTTWPSWLGLWHLMYQCTLNYFPQVFAEKDLFKTNRYVIRGALRKFLFKHCKLNEGSKVKWKLYIWQKYRNRLVICYISDTYSAFILKGDFTWTQVTRPKWLDSIRNSAAHWLCLDSSDSNHNQWLN